jgi:hypothetical protein
LLLDRNDHPGQIICNDYIDLELDELTRNLSEALGATLRPSILDRDSTALDSAELVQSSWVCPLALRRATPPALSASAPSE